MRGVIGIGTTIAPWLALACDPRGRAAIDRDGAGENVDMSTFSARDGAAEFVDMSTIANAGTAPEVQVRPPAWLATRGDAYRGEHTVRGRRFAFALWDSRRIALELVPGQVDPGGSGMVDPAVWPRLIAAFNGGFRGVHGEYGIRAEGRTFRPARSGLATLAQGADGIWLLGTLPEGQGLDAAEGFRQNLSPLLERGVFDPAQRGRFGALAPGKRDERTTRSALGLRGDGCFVYAYGIDVTPEELALALGEVDAEYGMALDINDGQAGFEWLTVAGASALRSPQPTREPMRATWNGVARGHSVRAERLTVPMGTPLPRWLGGDSRDYFVLWRPSDPRPPARVNPALQDWATFARKEK